MISLETLRNIDNLSTLEIAEVLFDISQKNGVSMWEASRELEKIANSLSKMNILLFTPDGRFRSLKK